MGSIALGSTILTQVLLRRPNVLALLLLATWALSPIGSQSSLQILTVGVHSTLGQLTVPYFNCDATPGFSEGDFWNGPSLNALFASSLMAPASIRNSSMDLWGNVKIPDISRLTAPANSTGWRNVPLQNTTYSSVLGVPLSNLPKEGNTTFLIETSYIALDCYDNVTATDAFYNYTVPDALLLENNTLPNGTYYAVIGPSDWNGENSTFPVDFERTFSLAINGFYEGGTYAAVTEYINDTTNYEPRTLLFQTRYGGVSAWCPITTRYVESAVECVGTDCSVISIRSSQLQHANSNLTDLGFISAFTSFCTYLMLASAAELHDGTSSALELYIGDPDSAPHAGLIYPNITGISASDLGIRLQQVINTYWFGSYDPVSMMGFLNLNMTDDLRPANLTLNTTANNVVFDEVYVLHFGWFFALLLATSTMLCAALVGAFFSWQIRGPEILGYTSTLLRDTPYTSAVKAGTTMDGLERARREGAMRVKLLDVDPDNEVGYIAVAEDVGRPGGGLIKGRYYR